MKVCRISIRTSQWASTVVVLMFLMGVAWVVMQETLTLSIINRTIKSMSRNDIPVFSGMFPRGTIGSPIVKQDVLQGRADAAAEAELMVKAPEETLDPDHYTYEFRQRSASNYSSMFSKGADGRLIVKEDVLRGRPGATAGLVLTAPELFEKIPTKFLDNFKNPCWLRGRTELNCLPYFYIIGMRKCATTDMWDKLVRHPDVITQVPKEPHWWGPRRYGLLATPINGKDVHLSRNVTGGDDHRPLEFYLNIYKRSVVPSILNHSVTTNDGRRYYPKVFGDASISTATTVGNDWMELFPDAAEPPYSNADLIGALQPDAKIMYNVRNPVKRLLSWYWRNHIDASADEVHEDMRGYIERFEDCTSRNTVRYCTYMGGCPYELLPNCQASIYHVFLRDWIKAFSKERVLVTRLEDWQENKTEVYTKVLDFLNLRRPSEEELSEILGRSTKNTWHKEHATEWPETVRMLEDFYRPHNQELADIMGDPKFLYES